MSLEPRGFIERRDRHGEGGFDHAPVPGGSGRLYVAHTTKDAVDPIDARRIATSDPFPARKASQVSVQ